MALVHRTPRYRKYSAILHAYIRAQPNTICWHCKGTLDQCPPHKSGSRPHWTAGHTIDGSENYDVWPHVTRLPPAGGDYLAPQCSSTNSSTGAAHGNRKREPSSGWLDA